MSASNPAVRVPFILASGSPRRRELLLSAGLEFTVQVSTAPEGPANPEENPRAYARRLAAEKAEDVAKNHRPDDDPRLILAADTVVIIDEHILGKPRDRADAKRMLKLLSGRGHEVLTAFCLQGPAGKQYQEEVRTEVRFKELSSTEIEAYLDTEEWTDKAGAYAIQGLAAYMVESICGSYTNVVGLPLCQVVEALNWMNG